MEYCKGMCVLLLGQCGLKGIHNVQTFSGDGQVGIKTGCWLKELLVFITPNGTIAEVDSVVTVQQWYFL